MNTWEWSNGARLSYLNWATDHPLGRHGDECAYVGRKKLWKSFSCEGIHPRGEIKFVCEKLHTGFVQCLRCAFRIKFTLTFNLKGSTGFYKFIFPFEISKFYFKFVDCIYLICYFSYLLINTKLQIKFTKKFITRINV